MRARQGRRVRVIETPKALGVARDTYALRSNDRRRVMPRQDEDVGIRNHVPTRVYLVKCEGLTESARSTGNWPVVRHTAPLGHDIPAGHWLCGPNQDCSGRTRPVCDDVETVMDTVAAVDVDRPRLGLHDVDTRAPIDCSVRGEIGLVTVGFGLDDPAREHYTVKRPNEDATNQVAGDVDRRTREEYSVQTISQQL